MSKEYTYTHNTESGCNMDAKSHAFDLGKVGWFKIAMYMRKLL